MVELPRFGGQSWRYGSWIVSSMAARASLIRSAWWPTEANITAERGLSGGPQWHEYFVAGYLVHPGGVAISEQLLPPRSSVRIPVERTDTIIYSLGPEPPAVGVRRLTNKPDLGDHAIGPANGGALQPCAGNWLLVVGSIVGIGATSRNLAGRAVAKGAQALLQGLALRRGRHGAACQ